jgi:hypothetical protein
MVFQPAMVDDWFLRAKLRPRCRGGKKLAIRINLFFYGYVQNIKNKKIKIKIKIKIKNSAHSIYVI